MKIKKIILNFLITVFSISLFSINSYALTDSNEEMLRDSGKETPRIENGDLIVTVDDIKSVKLCSFDTTNVGLHSCPPVEIEFTNLKPKDLLYHTGIRSKMFLFLDDKLLFEPAIPIYHPISSIPPNDLTLYYNFHDIDNSDIFYLREFYRDYSNDWYLSEAERDQIRKEQEERSKLRGEQFEVFLEYLKDASKLINNTTGSDPVATKESNAISIYPNPTTGELKIENGELKIQQISIFDMIGNKLPLHNERAVGKIDISHLPTGIYFVQVTTDKGVLTKRVVKR